MPEGPEIKQEADQIASIIEGKVIQDAYFAFPSLKGYEEILKGDTVQQVDTKGKALLTRFQSGYTIYSHNQLYGKWIIRPLYDYPETNRQLRLALHTDAHSALLYSASDIEVLKDEEVAEHPFIRKVGPDLLSETVTVTDLVQRFQSNRFRNRRWTALLLDQQFIAGIGNYLRSEIMFEANIHPDLRPVDCSDEQLHQAAEAVQTMVHRAYQANGITVDPALKRRLLKEGATKRHYRHYVFNREGEPCRLDGTEIIKIQANSRRFYYCPTCQQKESH
ncbi:endoribonuclease SymE [Pontibacillus halophilus JSM 076056 = DSM 19796]|uniref:DNA-(apurinic or apyrimidinic site) lyase n=1 Tax=Pontibacillus halophilus JSM 076056 = DSM 19796 TaxID=1385510 RepID=A0A0A5GFY5_9BACI|nr:endonuclease VIII [Pontibacillus halophilus]KGX90924.1 endoribonuclease SymE [Pontibacillus halophilus JSM 076056 = DSM 19796]